MVAKVDYELEEIVKKEAEADSVNAYLAKEKQIKREISKLKRQFKDIPKEKINLVDSTIKSVAFMSVTMEDLQENIVRVGTTVEYDNGGGQKGIKQSPDAQLYLQLSQKHTQAMKILLDLVPKATVKVESNDDEMDIRKFNKRK